MNTTLQMIFTEIKKLSIPPERLSGKISPQQAGLDSLSFVALAVALEERTGLVLDDDLINIFSFNTLKDLADAIDKQRMLNSKINIKPG